MARPREGNERLDERLSREVPTVKHLLPSFTFPASGLHRYFQLAMTGSPSSFAQCVVGKLWKPGSYERRRKEELEKTIQRKGPDF
jgi:hypothetical protein